MWLCPLCQKPFAKDLAYKRHVSYCRRSLDRPRTRPRSCQSCNAAKVKCTFQTPCRRCEVKGLDCVYETQPRKAQSTREDAAPTLGSSSDEHVIVDDFESLEAGLMYAGNANSLGMMPPAEANTQVSSVFAFQSDSGNMDGISWDPALAGMDISFSSDTWAWPHASIQPRIGDSAQAPWSLWNNVATDHPAPWDTNEPDLLSSVASAPRIRSLQRALQPLPSGMAVFRQNTRLVMEAVRAYPLMMLRRETFPPFIHPHWHNTHAPALPEPLGHCMSIAHMFAFRGEETKPFLWQAMEAEIQRLVTQRHNFTLECILAAIQSVIIYMIMRFVDGSSEPVNMNAMLVVTYQLLCKEFKKNVDEKLHQAFCEVDNYVVRPSWEEWVFAESRRRTACLFYMMCRCISFDTEECDAFEIFKMLPLPTPKSLWEAKTRVAWEAEYTAYTSGHGPVTQSINTMAMLVDVHRKSHEPFNRQLLDHWNSGTDNLSTLLNLAASVG